MGGMILKSILWTTLGDLFFGFFGWAFLGADEAAGDEILILYVEACLTQLPTYLV